MRVIVEQLVEWRLTGETEVLGENVSQRHFVHHKIPHDQTRAAAVGSQRLTTSAMALPSMAPSKLRGDVEWSRGLSLYLLPIWSKIRLSLVNILQLDEHRWRVKAGDDISAK
jgi:hypothetical protein